ncbi:VHS1093 protein [Vibrio phage 1]|nr:VHS1093 protein [Vibrio phage 1]
MNALENKIESFSYDNLIADCMKAIKAAVEARDESKEKDAEVIAMVAYENTYEAKAADKYLKADELTYDYFLSSMIESANLIITHDLF